MDAKLICGRFLILLLLGGCGQIPFSTVPSLGVFDRPLIAGASVSADFGATSPGRYIAEMVGVKPLIIAHIGSSGSASELLPELTPEVLSNASVIIALDIMFWDSWRKDCARGIQAAHTLFDKAVEAQVPIILGTVPKIEVDFITLVVAGVEIHQQRCVEELNTVIRALCTLKNHCLLIDLANFYVEIQSGMVIDNDHYTFKDLMPDGLHLSETLSKKIAEHIYFEVEKVRDVLIWRSP